MTSSRSVLLAAATGLLTSTSAFAQCGYDIASFYTQVKTQLGFGISAWFTGDCGTQVWGGGVNASAIGFHTYHTWFECPDGDEHVVTDPDSGSDSDSSSNLGSIGAYASILGGNGAASANASAGSFSTSTNATTTSSIDVLTGGGGSKTLIDFLVASPTASGSLTVVRTGGTTCELHVTEYVSAHMEIINNAPSLSPRDRGIGQLVFPVGSFIEAVYTFSNGSSTIGTARKQGVIGYRPDDSKAKLGILDSEDIEEVIDTYEDAYYGGTIETPLTLPIGTVNVSVESQSRSFEANGDLDVDGDGNHMDLIAMHAANGSSIGDANYLPEADLDLNGVIDEDDYVLLNQFSCPADADDDGDVDEDDFLVFQNAYNLLTSTAGDFNGDGLTDDADAAFFTTAYNALLCPTILHGYQ